jgi:hypothetical protein
MNSLAQMTNEPKGLCLQLQGKKTLLEGSSTQALIDGSSSKVPPSNLSAFSEDSSQPQTLIVSISIPSCNLNSEWTEG